MRARSTRRLGFSPAFRVVSHFLSVLLMFVGVTLFSTQGNAYAAPLVIPAAAAVGVAVPSGATIAASLGTIGAFTGAAIFPDETKAVTQPVIAAGSWYAEQGYNIMAGSALFTGRAIGMAWKWLTGDNAGTTYDPPATGGTPSGTFGSPGTNSNTQHGDCCSPSYTVEVAPGTLTGGTITVKTFQSPTCSYYCGSFDYAYYARVYAVGTYGSRELEGWGTTQYPFTKSWSLPVNTESWRLYSNQCGCFTHVYTLGGNAGTGGTPSSAPGTTVVTTKPTSTCSNGATIVGEAITFTGNTPSSDLPPILAPSCPQGTFRTGLTTPSTYPDGTTAPSPMQPWTAPTIPNGYPECNGTNGVCVLTLTRTAVEGNTEVCNASGLCEGWSRSYTPEIVKATNYTGTAGVGQEVQTLPDGSKRLVVRARDAQGREYSCRYGPYIIPVVECKVVPVNAPTANPEQSARDCLGSEITLTKPWTWVLGPVKCALRWAFVPSAGAAQGWANRIGTIKTRFPVNIAVGGFSFITGIVDVARGTQQTQCDFRFRSAYGHSFDPICSAGQTMQSDAKGRFIYRLGQIAIIGGFFWWAWRRVSASFGGKESTDT